MPVSLLRHRQLHDPDPAITLAPGDRISLLTPVTGRSSARDRHYPGSQPHGHPHTPPPALKSFSGHPASSPDGPEPGQR